jgi:hypothetical protein
MGRGINETTAPPLTEENRNKNGNPGTPWRLTRSGVRRLEELEFDPIVKMVEFYNEITEELKEMRTQQRYSAVAYAQLRSSQRQAIEVLMQYGYIKRKPDEKDPSEMQPMRIILETSNKNDDTPANKAR